MVGDDDYSTRLEAIMQHQKLQQIDQDLIKLLGERISVLASGIPTMQEQISNCSTYLVEAGVPESVWQNVVLDCIAAVNTASSSVVSIEPRNVTAIGGDGMMGRFFGDRLRAAGHNVSVLEYNDWDNAEQLLSQADLVLVCVPLKSTLAVIQKAARYFRPTTALVDIASIKTPFVQAMLEQHQGPVLGLHPMFGPGVKSFLSQKVVVCPGRGDEAFQWFLDAIKNDGGKLITCTPEEHDQMMIAVQAIRHFSTFSLGVFLAEEEIDIARSLDFASPIYRLESNIVSRLFAQDGSLYIDIILGSKERTEAIARLAQTYSRLAELVAHKDRSALMREFVNARNAFEQESDRALEESNYVINAMSTLLAANEVKANLMPAPLKLT
ncbi:MAG TPA: bifunctional chorismate mutase/prephenate dehydrogenase [Leptolyngbyaceae cyanobacterium]